jgi:hypothetical protein
MANDFLRVRNAIPLEREYEGWIVREIEDYLALSGRKATIFGVGSAREKIWPADEELNVAGKVVGLQFKRPSLSNPPGNDPTHSRRLHWKLGSPASQLNLVLNTPEIFYALPTFTDPKYKRVSLHHCLFWRPENAVRKTVWYNNPGANPARSYLQVEGATRWGHYMEKLVRCLIGRALPAGGFQAYVNNLQADVSPDLGGVRARSTPTAGIYIIFIPRLPGQAEA